MTTPRGCRRRPLAYCSLAVVCYTVSAGAHLNAQDTDSTCMRLCEALLKWLLVESLKFVTFFPSLSPPFSPGEPVYTQGDHTCVCRQPSQGGGLSLSRRRCTYKAILLAIMSPLPVVSTALANDCITEVCPPSSLPTPGL